MSGARKLTTANPPTSQKKSKSNIMVVPVISKSVVEMDIEEK